MVDTLEKKRILSYFPYLIKKKRPFSTIQYTHRIELYLKKKNFNLGHGSNLKAQIDIIKTTLGGNRTLGLGFKVKCLPLETLLIIRSREKCALAIPFYVIYILVPETTLTQHLVINYKHTVYD